LHVAAQFGLDTIARNIICQLGDFDINLKNWGMTPLMVAAKQGHQAVVHLLLDQKDIDVESKGIGASFRWEQPADNVRVARFYLENGVKYDKKDCEGRTWLAVCALNGWNKVAQLLLDHGADIESTDKNGRTPLSRCWNSFDLARLLIEKGANIHSRDTHGRSVLSNIITEYEWSTDICRQDAGTRKEILRYLLERGADVHLHDNSQRSPLSWAAASHAQSDAKRLLLENGADVNSLDCNGQTPLYLSSAIGCEVTTQLLLNHGAKFELADKFGQTPLSLAISKGHTTIVCLLEQKAAEFQSISSTPKEIIPPWIADK
ncbi:ankyrin repeat-containing domain protein, partial [Pyronema domesticum]